MCEYQDLNVEEPSLENEEGEDEEVDGMKLLDLNPLDELILDTGPGTPRSWRYSLATNQGIHQLSRDGQLEELKRLLSDESVQAKINNLDEKKCSPLHYATRYSHMEIVNLLLEQPTTVVDRIGADQMTPFHYGCRYGRHEEHGNTRRRSRIDEETELEEDYLGIRVLKKLLQCGANVDAKDAYNMTGLHHAAMRGNISVVKFLVSSLGANQLLNQRDIQGSTALHIASTYGHAEVVKLLLDAGADIRLICLEKKTALHRAAQEGNIQVMKVLMEHDEFSVLAQRKDKDQYSVLLLAVDGGCLDLVQLLLEHGLQPQVSWKNNVGEVPLHSAARTGLKDMVQTLVEHGADIDCTNGLQQTPLYIAAQSGKLEIVEYLLEQDADHNIWDSQRLSPIMIAGVEGHVQIVRALKERGANIRSVDSDDLNILHLVARTNQSLVLQEISTYEECENLLNANNQFDETPLHIAADAGNVDCVKILLEIGGDVDNKNEDEQTPCHLAARSGHAEVIRVILEKDKNAIFDKDEDEQTPLHIASKYQRADCLKILLENNAKVQDRNNKGWTPLDCAAAAGAFRCAEILLEYNSPVDPMDKKMTTPLHLAAQFGHSNVVELLLMNGADVTLTNLDGENALEIAIIHGKKSVAETILTSDVWRLSLRSTSTAKDSRGTPVPNTPLRMLIRTFPDLAELVFDKCLSVKKINRKGSYGSRRRLRKFDRVVELDFEFLEDIFNLQEVGTGERIRFNISLGGYWIEDKV
ncbi:serine/threonine-protein phosphatase 6 regulatory ankyrin repeat subunit B isoform X3 [Eurytemora carolleeae]|uniref:serine/threonine-protein phosphatase 6 regulatory ankyrin repeat subunit B isoform X3 n=1 Tax=Eurytemora carolleeae TaxID=1294199 RepID=UPI000C779870|nr:serine/threonine-protein phosphatase 6 regulatory ankyrin repeat subunit B isoform X3 [Eurytemora carolleeae]|eukprot:XP_023346201.1 serine/threonine-protein phosphatase 6 regulatory ankyrin repeat subunit B-like isoform X3 [Eurytemora affinis]